MYRLRIGRSIAVFFIVLFLFPVFLVPEAKANEEARVSVCATLSEVGAQWREFLERSSVDPTPEVIPLFYLPRDECGYVDWAEALRQGVLAPRDSIEEKYSPVTADESPGDIILPVESSEVANVIFPHDVHIKLLDCKTCHPGIFKKEAGGSEMSMASIMEGEFCGRCHGQVSFPLSNCSRCHSGAADHLINK